MLSGQPRCDPLRAHASRPHRVRTDLPTYTRRFAGARSEDWPDGQGASLWQERYSAYDRKRARAQDAFLVIPRVSADNSSCPRHAIRSSQGIPFARKAGHPADNSHRQGWSRTMAGHMAVQPAQKSQPEAHAGAEATRTAAPGAAQAMAVKEHRAATERAKAAY